MVGMNYTTFDKVDPDVYERYRPCYPDSVPASVMKFAGCKKVDTILDVGCGTGKSTVSYSKYAEKVIGIDISEPALDVAKLKNSRKNIEYIAGSAYDIPLSDKSVDIIVCATSAHWFDIPRFLKECDRLIKAGGTLAMYAYKHPMVRLLHNKTAQNKCNEITERFMYQMPYLAEGYNDYQGIFTALPNKNKLRIEDYFIDGPKSLENLWGFLMSLSPYQSYAENSKKELVEQNGDDAKFDEVDLRRRYIEDIRHLCASKSTSNDDNIISFEFKIFGVVTKRPFF